MLAIDKYRNATGGADVHGTEYVSRWLRDILDAVPNNAAVPQNAEQWGDLVRSEDSCAELIVIRHARRAPLMRNMMGCGQTRTGIPRLEQDDTAQACFVTDPAQCLSNGAVQIASSVKQSGDFGDRTEHAAANPQGRVCFGQRRRPSLGSPFALAG